MAEIWAQAEPWGGSVPSWDHLPPLQRWQAEERYAEQQARREEREREEARAQRAEQREAMLFRSGMEWSAARAQPFDPTRPYANIPSPEALADMAEAVETAETRRRAREALREAGVPVSLLRSALPEPPADGVPVLAALGPTADELAEAQLRVAHRRTVSAKIRRILGRNES